MKAPLFVCFALQIACSGRVDRDSPCPSAPAHATNTPELPQPLDPSARPERPERPEQPERPEPRRPPAAGARYRWRALDAAIGCSGHTATALDDGRTLIRGACELAGEAVWALIYDPQTQSFAPLAASARREHSATKLLDGRVLFAGGLTNASAMLWTGELFVPGPDVLVPGPQLTGVRAQHTAERLADGRVMVVGGSVAGFNAMSAELWDAKSVGFTKLTPMPVPRSMPVSVLLGDGSVLVAGGGPSHASRFVPSTLSWESSPLSGDVRSMALVAPDRVLAFSASSVDLFETATGTQTQLLTGIVPHVALAPLDGGVLALGGSFYTLLPPPAVVELETPSLTFLLDGPELGEDVTATPLADGSVLVVSFGAWLYAREP
jgi:hypothetical protein